LEIKYIHIYRILDIVFLTSYFKYHRIFRWVYNMHSVGPCRQLVVA